MKDTPKKPLVTKGLIEYLEVMFPDRCPDITASNRAVWMAAGKVDVVKHLRMLYEKQNTTATTN